MAAVDISIGHDDDLVVTQLLEVQGFAVLLGANSHAKGGVNVLDLLAVEHAVFHGLLDVQDLTTQRQDGLEVTVAARLGRTTCGVTLDEVKLGLGGVAFGAVGQLARQAEARQGAFALHLLAGVACRLASLGGQGHLVEDGLGFLGVLFQIVGELLSHDAVDDTHDLVVAEFGLGLAFKLRFRHLHRDDGGKAFAEVIGRDLHLQLL